MRQFRIAMVTVLAVLVCLGPTAQAEQKGLGGSTGIAREAEKPPVVSMSGQVVEIKTGPCEKSTGKSLVGTHLLIQTKEDGKLNLHLGPTSAVRHIVEQLSVGQLLTFEGFHTEQMPGDAYIAKSLTLDDKVIHLRDDSLRPSWASPRGRSQSRGPGIGQGQGMYGPCG